jgi:aspartyl-tRNA(Asn)/glutamyl-tRNA(Gln) amidotransferase subunit A
MTVMNFNEYKIEDLSSKIKTGELKATALIESVLANIKEENRRLNSFITISEDFALRQAERLENRISKKEKTGRLAGIPVAVKDNIAVRDCQLTCGSLILEGFVSPYNATVIERLIEEDAIIIGKTNMDEFAMGSSNEYSAFGNCKNPLNPDLVPGGSSGGSAASLAAGLVPLALGSDTGGSVRQPAAFCGVTGFKPGYGRVSRYGLVAFSSSLDQIGPFGRNVKATRLLYDIIKGVDHKDLTTTDSVSSKKPLKKKIAVLSESFESKIDSDIVKAMIETVNLLKENGYEVDTVDFPYGEEMIAMYYIIAPAECSANLSRFDGVRYGKRIESTGDIEGSVVEYMYSHTREKGFGPEVKRRIMLELLFFLQGIRMLFIIKLKRHVLSYAQNMVSYSKIMIF